jgi:two-component system, NarL family, sensor histidine kinase DevS
MAGYAGPDALRRLVEAAVSVGVDLDLHAVLQRVVVAATDLSEARYGALGVLDADGKTLSDFITVGLSDDERLAIGALPKGHGLLGHVIEQAAPVRTPDLNEHPVSAGVPENHPPMHSFLGVPIRVGDKVFGNLYLTDKLDDEAFTDIDEEILVSFASAAGVAIEHARLFETIAHRERVIESFNTVASLLLQGRPRDEVLGCVAISARELVGAALSSIVLPDGEGGMYVPAADGRLAEAYRGRSIASARISDRVAHLHTAGSVEDLSSDPMVGRFIENLGPTLYVPITLDGASYGCIVLIRVQGDTVFNEQDVDLLGRFASQAAVVLENDRRREREAELIRTADHFRIAEHLQDSALQEIFAASLRLSGAAVVAETPDVQARIHETIEGLDRAIKLTRQAIFDLKTGGDAVS